MSVFGDNQNTGNEENQSFVKKLVEQKGEKWSDPETMAKGKIEADNYIEELEAEKAAMQAELEKAKKVEELLEQMERKAAQPASANASSGGGTNESDTQTSISEDQIQSLIEQKLTEREKTATARQNLEQVNSALTDMFGDEANNEVQKKAEELGMDFNRLQSIASESPTAFFALMGEQPKTLPSMTKGSINTESVNHKPSGRRNNSYYQNLRKTDRKAFLASMDQMIQDRLKLGDDFYA
jgi:hypothetical protein